MAYIIDINMAFPKNYYTQENLIKGLKAVWDSKVKNSSHMETIHKNTLVKGRHLALPLEEYLKDSSFTERNQQFVEHSAMLAKDCVETLIDKNDITYSDISSLWSNTITGFAIPSIEARLMNLLPFKMNTKRIPLLGLGCMAGVAGMNRAAEYLKGHPHEALIFFSVELCSLTFQMQDVSGANIVSTGLFGDGAAAVLMVGDKHPLKAKAKMKFISSESVMFPDTLNVMGWNVGSSGLKIVLSKGVPELTETEIPKLVNSFLTDNKIDPSEISSHLAHPGGPKVLSAMEKGLGVGPKSLSLSWESLAENGNMSSVSVLDIIHRSLKQKHKPNTYALAIAMGPAFSAELGLFQWV